MPWFLGCRCCRAYVTTRKLGLDLSLVWNGDWGPTVQPGPLTADLYPDDSEELIVLTGIAVDSTGRVWNTGQAYTQDVTNRVYQVTAKEFKAANGDLTNRSFDWNADVQGDAARGPEPLLDVAINSQDEILFGGGAQFRQSFNQYVAATSLRGTDVTLDPDDPIFGIFTDVGGDCDALATDPITDGFFYGRRTGFSSPSGAAAYRNRMGTGWGQFLIDFPGEIPVFGDSRYYSGRVIDVYPAIFGALYLATGGATDRLYFFDESNGAIADPFGATQIIYLLGTTVLHNAVAWLSPKAVLGIQRRTFTPVVTEGDTALVGESVYRATLFPGDLNAPDAADRVGSVRADWSFDAGGNVLDLDIDAEGNIHAVGDRVENHVPVLTTYTWNGSTLVSIEQATFPEIEAATAWKLDANGNLLASFDHGQTLRRVVARGQNVYVCGDRAKDSEAKH